MKIGDITDTMKLDKKSRGGKIEMALPRTMGSMAEIDGSYGIKIEDSPITDAIR